MRIMVTLVIHFATTKYASQVEAERTVQCGLLNGDLLLDDIRYSEQTQGFRTLIVSDQISEDE